MPNLRRVGAEAEDRAATYLLDKGYTIVTRRYQLRGGEIDLVALDGEMLVFVEVKIRRTQHFVPEEGLTEQKKRFLAAAAGQYAFWHGEEERPWRYDLVAIDRQSLRHYPDVFRPED